jgi:RAD3-like DEAD/DEAH box helicase
LYFLVRKNFKKIWPTKQLTRAISSSMTDVSPKIVYSSALDWAHPVVREWFLTRLGVPTEPQQRGWPQILAGKTTLISAPTGSGKTLAAFLACIDRLVRKALAGELLDETQVFVCFAVEGAGQRYPEKSGDPAGRNPAACRPARPTDACDSHREVLMRESNLPNWPEILITLRRLEDRGEVRGGRFVAGFLGEQFALPAAVESLRATRAEPPIGETITISAADPLNLVGIIVPCAKVLAISSRFVTYATALHWKPANPSITPQSAKPANSDQRSSRRLISYLPTAQRCLANSSCINPFRRRRLRLPTA